VPGIEVKGGKELRATLKAAGDGFPKELRQLNLSVAKIVQPIAQAQAASMGGMQAHFASKIRATASQKEARIGVASVANAAFWGAKKHSGWYAAERYRESKTPQFPRWVGNAWDVGGSGGPYALNDAVRLALPSVMSEFETRIGALLERAGT